jgi:hypothetical protein
MQDFEEELKKYRFWNRVVIFGFLFCALIWTLPLMLSRKLLSIDNEFVLFGFGVFFTFISLVFLDRFRCPRCRKLFTRKNWYSKTMMAASCVHCGLSAYKKD